MPATIDTSTGATIALSGDNSRVVQMLADTRQQIAKLRQDASGWGIKIPVHLDKTQATGELRSLQEYQKHVQQAVQQGVIEGVQNELASGQFQPIRTGALVGQRGVGDQSRPLPFLARGGGAMAAFYAVQRTADAFLRTQAGVEHANRQIGWEGYDVQIAGMGSREGWKRQVNEWENGVSGAVMSRIPIAGAEWQRSVQEHKDALDHLTESYRETYAVQKELAVRLAQLGRNAPEATRAQNQVERDQRAQEVAKAEQAYRDVKALRRGGVLTEPQRLRERDAILNLNRAKANQRQGFDAADLALRQAEQGYEVEWSNEQAGLIGARMAGDRVQYGMQFDARGEFMAGMGIDYAKRAAGWRAQQAQWATVADDDPRKRTAMKRIRAEQNTFDQEIELRARDYVQNQPWGMSTRATEGAAGWTPLSAAIGLVSEVRDLIKGIDEKLSRNLN